MTQEQTRKQIMNELAAAPVDPGIGLLFGVKAAIDAICELVAVYDRHRGNVSQQLPATVVQALDILAAGCEVIRSLNPPGPR